MTVLANKPQETKANPLLAIGKGVDELAHIARALATSTAGNRTLLRARDEQELLDEMCGVIVRTGGYRFATVAYAEQNDQRSIRWMAGFGIDPHALEGYNFTWDDTELGQTSVATAIRTGKPTVGRRILTDPIYAGPGYAGLRERAVQYGYASMTSFPLRVEGEILGALNVAAADPNAFNDAEVKLLGELADDLAFGITNLRTRAQRREAHDTIARLAYYDCLTGLPNRTLLLEELQAAMDVAKQHQLGLALLHLEVGHFHEVNKVLGYKSGDNFQKELAQRLAQELDKDEILARVGEAEFALLLPSCGEERAVQIARRLLDVLKKPVEVSGIMLDARVGIGIATFPEHATDADTLIRCANAALHQSKAIRHCYAVYMGGKESEDTRRLSLMGDLHRAIENSEFQLYCQPKVDMASGSICGAEALIRWIHPEKGMISPSEFIPLAEHAGMVTQLTNWMLDAVFRQSHSWFQGGRPWPMAINLSALDLYDSDLFDRVSCLFSTWGIDPDLIQFELTESALMVDKESTLDTLTSLKRLGVQLAVDDFGTGQSSLNYLQMLPVDIVKIDQSFVMPMVANSDSAVIVRATIELAHNLGMKVVAEGVESQVIWDRLVELGCDTAQGYHLSMPMPASQFQGWAATYSSR